MSWLLNTVAKLFAFWPALSQRLAVRAFYWGGGEALRYGMVLGKGSLVIDLGGFEGDFAAEMRRRFQATVWVFEPVKAFAAAIQRRFKKDKSVKVFAFGLAGKAARQTFYIAGPATGSGADGSGQAVKAELKAAESFLRARKAGTVALMKINIEGGEFELLESLLAGRRAGSIERLQIQFHPHVQNAVGRRGAIRELLRRTHELEWDFPWIWESWKLRKASRD